MLPLCFIDLGGLKHSKEGIKSISFHAPFGTAVAGIGKCIWINILYRQSLLLTTFEGDHKLSRRKGPSDFYAYFQNTSALISAVREPGFRHIVPHHKTRQKSGHRSFILHRSPRSIPEDVYRNSAWSLSWKRCRTDRRRD